MPPTSVRGSMTEAAAAPLAIVRSTGTVIEFTGPAAVQCLQGLVSNDLVRSGEPSLTYAGILTPKGLLIADCWLLRAAGRLVLVAPSDARAALLEVFRRSLPPRLARVIDHSEAWGILWCWDGVPASASGGVVDGEVLVAWRAPRPWFDRLMVGPLAALDALVARHLPAGVAVRDDAWADARRIHAGWPRLGYEIDEKTLVQEVRFDENGGVSYEKGCYTGQETVARLHFRGHTNRALRGLVFQGASPGRGAEVSLDDRVIGRVTSHLETPGRRIGLALLRREVDNGAHVTAGGLPATVVALPFEEAPEN